MKKKEFIISLQVRDPSREAVWKSELKTLLRSLKGEGAFRVSSFRDEPSDFVLIDAAHPSWRDWARDFDREGKSLVLGVEEAEFLPSGSDLELVDDVLVHPFRAAEVMSVLRHHFKKMETEQVMEESLAALKDLQEANAAVERILMEKTPKRFTGLKGIRVMSKHLSGVKPGGDYFDVFESEKKDFANFLLVDSSSYGVSAALLGVLLSSSAKLSGSQQVSPFQWIRTIHEELKSTLGEEGHFSIFLGRLNRRDFSLHYQLYGSIEVFLVNREGMSTALEKNGDPIDSRFDAGSEGEKVVVLQPKDRLVLLSDGFVAGSGGRSRLTGLFKDQLEQDPFSLVTELAFQIKSQLSPGETFPGEDCSAIVIDIEGRVLRLAPTG